MKFLQKQIAWLSPAVSLSRSWTKSIKQRNGRHRQNSKLLLVDQWTCGPLGSDCGKRNRATCSTRCTYRHPVPLVHLFFFFFTVTATKSKNCCGSEEEAWQSWLPSSLACWYELPRFSTAPNCALSMAPFPHKACVNGSCVDKGVHRFVSELA